MLEDEAYDGWTDDLARLISAPAAVPPGTRDRLHWIWPRGRDVPALLAALAHLPASHSPAADAALALTLDLLDRALCARDKPNRGDLNFRPLADLATWLPAGNRLWAVCMDKIVRVATAIGEVNHARTREPIARWADIFLEPVPQRTRADYREAAFGLGRWRVTDADVLFPRLLPALDDPRKRAAVLDIASECTAEDDEREWGSRQRPAALPEHPLAGRLDFLGRLIAEAAEADVTPDAIEDARTAANALARMQGDGPASMLAGTLSHPAAQLRLDTAARFAARPDERGRDVLRAALADPLTREEAMTYLPSEEAEDSLGVRIPWACSPVRDWLGDDEFDRQVEELGERVERWMDFGAGDPPPDTEVVTLHHVEWPGDPDPDFICAVRHAFPCGPDGQTVVLTVTGNRRGWSSVGGAAASAATVVQQEVVSGMYDRGLWVIERAESRRSPYERLFADWPGGSLKDLCVQAVADVQPLDDHPVAVATARWRGERGWAVAHGRQTRWYPTADADAPKYAVGALGRYVAFDLLGLTDNAPA